MFADSKITIKLVSKNDDTSVHRKTIKKSTNCINFVLNFQTEDLFLFVEYLIFKF